MKNDVNKSRSGESISRTVWPWMGLALAVLLAAVHPAHGLTPVSSCGQTLSTPGQYVLAGDLDCSGTSANGINIAANKVVLHLAGHTLSSADCDATKGIAGINILSGLAGVQVEGGTVKGFNDGIVLYSSKSRVNGVTVTGACMFGIAVSGQDNRIDTSVVTQSGIDGIGIGAASGIHVISNDISGNARVGVDISNFSNGNFVEDNLINNNGLVDHEQGGVAIFNGSGNLIANNSINNNFNGVELESPGNILQSNTVNGSVGSGIFVLTIASPSTLQRNTVLGSAVVDLSDDNAGCSGDTWSKNIFVTDVVAGVSDGGPGTGCIR